MRENDLPKKLIELISEFETLFLNVRIEQPAVVRRQIQKLNAETLTVARVFNNRRAGQKTPGVRQFKTKTQDAAD